MRQEQLVELILHPGSEVAGEAFRSVALLNPTVSAFTPACRDSNATFVGLGGLSGSVDADAVHDAARQIDAAVSDVMVLPLKGYEWLELLADVPSPVWTRVPQVTEGALIVARREQLLTAASALGPKSPLSDIPAHLADTGCRIRILAPPAPRTTAAPLVQFAPPALVPDDRRRPAPDLEQRLEFDKGYLPPLQSAEDLTALRAGLFQVHNALQRSHTLAQSIEGRGRHQSGDYWHAIMHRREPDYANSKYWFRHVGRHPIHPELASRAAPLLAAADGDEVARWRPQLGSPGRWDSMSFVDLCAASENDENGPLGQLARRIQWVEMLLLLRSTCQDAFLTATAGA